MTLQHCLANAARYGIGSSYYAIATARCFAQYQGQGIPVNPDNVTFWTHDTWKKTSHDLLKYLMESGKCSANCARVAERAFLSTGWERSRKVSDVARTVYNITTAKRLCSEQVAILAQSWVNANLNTYLKLYTRKPEVKPEPIIPVIPPKETQKDTYIESLDVSTSGDEVIVLVNLFNPGKSTEEVRAEMFLRGKMIDREPDYHWKNIRSGKRETLKLSSHWKTGNIEKALAGEVRLIEQHLGYLDKKTFGLGGAGIWVWLMGLGWKGLLAIGIAIIIFLSLLAASKTPQVKAIKKVLK